MTHKEISRYANTIYTEFKPDLSDFEKKVRDRWNKEFDNIDMAITIADFFRASNSVFQFGSQYIRDEARYSQFRDMYHILSDMIQDFQEEIHEHK